MTNASMSPERLEQLKKAEPAIYFHIEEMFQNGTYNKKERELLRRLIDLGNSQLGAAFSWFECDIIRARHEMDYLEGVIEQWDRIPPSKRPKISREAVTERLLNLTSDISHKGAVIEKARREGYFWSIVPLLEYFDLTEEERAGKSCYPLLPNLMQKAYMRMLSPNSESLA